LDDSVFGDFDADGLLDVATFATNECFDVYFNSGTPDDAQFGAPVQLSPCSLRARAAYDLNGG
jgi:hypothetical protein